MDSLDGIHALQDFLEALVWFAEQDIATHAPMLTLEILDLPCHPSSAFLPCHLLLKVGMQSSGFPVFYLHPPEIIRLGVVPVFRIFFGVFVVKKTKKSHIYC